MAVIDYWVFPLSPCADLAGKKPEVIAERNKATITCKPFMPDKVFERNGGIKLEDRHELRRACRLQDIARIAVAEAMMINPVRFGSPPIRFPFGPRKETSPRMRW